MATGRRRVQARLVEPAARSLNSGDCFLLVTPERCFRWTGEFANEQEQAKVSLPHNPGLIPGSPRSSPRRVAWQACELASTILRRSDLGCRVPEVVHLEEGLNCDGGAAEDFWRLLGGRTRYRGERSGDV